MHIFLLKINLNICFFKEANLAKSCDSKNIFQSCFHPASFTSLFLYVCSSFMTICITCVYKYLLCVFQNGYQGFPGGSVVKNLPVNAGDMGSIPDPGRFHMLQSILSPGTSTIEPMCRNLKSVCPGAHALQQEKPPQ